MPDRPRLGEQIPVRFLRWLPTGLAVLLPDHTTGFIRERELGWDSSARSQFRQHRQPQDEFRAVVVGFGPDGRPELSVRQAQADPWSGIAERYQPGDLLTGVVTGIQPYGVFVELEGGVTGLAHATRLPVLAPGVQAGDVFWPGDRVKVAITAIDRATRRISLSMRDLHDVRWRDPANLSPPRKLAGRPGRADRPAPLPIELLLNRGSRTILVVEDDPQQNTAVANWLRHAGQSVITAQTGAEALAALAGMPSPDIALIDVGLPGMNGLELLERLSHDWPQVRTVLMTDWSRLQECQADLDRARSAGSELLLKPLLPEDLLNVLLDGEEAREPAAAAPRDAAAPRPREPGRAPETEGLKLAGILQQLRRLTRASKVVLFALDPTQRRIEVIAESGSGVLHPAAILDLIHSPVRDVAEDRVQVHLSNLDEERARFRYLAPLLPFASCLGLPVPAGLAQRYALFLFHGQPHAFAEAGEQAGRAAAFALGTYLERQVFAEQMVESQRLVLLGQLTRAMVHEVNNQLGPIIFSLDTLRSQVAGIARLAASNSPDTEREADRAGHTLGTLLASTRSLANTARTFGNLTRSEQQQILFLDAVIAEIADLIRDTADRAHVEVELIPPPHLMVTRTQVMPLQQAMINVLLNAIQQIEKLRPDGPGRVRIALNEVQDNEDVLLKVTVEDDGPGVHRRLWDRVFELGFTTRDGGSGIGLYITKSLVTALGGRVYVAESCMLWGTTFAIELPFRLL